LTDILCKNHINNARMRSVSVAVFTAWLAHQVAAHGSVNSVSVGSTKYTGYEPSNKPGTPPNPAKGVVWASNDEDIGFVLPTDYSNANIICHKNASPAPKAATVAAGGTISLSWPNWPKTDPHPGVFLNYLAAAGTDDPTKIDKNQLSFFKISQAGYDPTVDVKGPDAGLATGSFKKAGLVAQVQIPANIKPGTYVLRHEIIALHEAEQINKAQNYPQCVTVQVTGGGSATPDGVPATQLYKATDPGVSVPIILINAIQSNLSPDPS
jgi:methionine-rich copper-binding protein CopC